MDSDSNVAQPDSWQETYATLGGQSNVAAIKAFYQAGIVAESTPISEVPLIALDFETTGLDPRQDEIVSIGVVPFNTQRIRCRDAGHWLVKPRQPLNDPSIVIHGITHTDICAAPDVSELLPVLLHKLAGKVVVAHFSQIEQAFLNQALSRCFGETLELPMIDTYTLERLALEARHGLLGRLLRRPLGSLRLSDSRTRYGLPHYQPHQAQTDALATAELLQAQLAYHYRENTAVGQLWQPSCASDA